MTDNTAIGGQSQKRTANDKDELKTLRLSKEDGGRLISNRDVIGAVEGAITQAIAPDATIRKTGSQVQTLTPSRRN